MEYAQVNAYEDALVALLQGTTSHNRQPRSEAINASVGRKVPGRSRGGVTAVRVPIRCVTSTRRYSSVVWVLSWPSQRATWRISPVACKTFRAHGVPKHVGRDPFGAKHGTLRARRNGVLVEEIGEAARAISQPRAREELGYVSFSMDSQPRPHRVGDYFPDSENPLLSALAPHTQGHRSRVARQRDYAKSLTRRFEAAASASLPVACTTASGQCIFRSSTYPRLC